MRDETGYLEPQQIEQLIKSADNLRDKMLLYTLTRTGRRISEVVGSKPDANGLIKSPGLRPIDINPDENQITFVVLKAKKARLGRSIIPKTLTDKLLSYINYYHIAPNSRLFPISRERAWQIVRKTSIRAGLKGIGNPPMPIRPHHLRHSFAINFARNCQNPKDITELKQALGHTNINATIWYIEKFNMVERAKIIESMFGD